MPTFNDCYRKFYLLVYNSRSCWTTCMNIGICYDIISKQRTNEYLLSMYDVLKKPTSDVQ